MSQLSMFAADLVAIAVLVLALFLPRHGRRDLVVAFLCVNVGVLAVASALATSSAGAGLGLGLFGVLSIIRLRSEELAQHEIAYYFASLALGLLGGLAVTPSWLVVALMVLVLASIWVGDHPRLTRATRRTVLLLDRALTDESALTAHLEALLGAKVRRVAVQRVDVVNDTTLVEVRHDAAPSRAPLAAPVTT